MSASVRRIFLCVGVLAATGATVSLAQAQNESPYKWDDLVANINTYVDKWAARPPLGKALLKSYADLRTLELPFSDKRRDVLREVLEMKVSHMAKGLRDQYEPAVSSQASRQEMRRLWRLQIRADVQASGRNFQKEAIEILAPITAALILGYTDSSGRPEKAVQYAAVLLLGELPGSQPAKVNALLRLLRSKGADQGILIIVVNELGRQKIAGAVPGQVSILSSDNLVLQAAAARALGLIGDEKALQPLLDLLARTGDTTVTTPEAARNAMLSTIEAIRGVMAQNAPAAPAVKAKVVAALMRCVLTDPDRTVVVAAANAVRSIGQYSGTISLTAPEPQFQTDIERIRQWWLEQDGAEALYQAFFRLEPITD